MDRFTDLAKTQLYEIQDYILGMVNYLDDDDEKEYAMKHGQENMVLIMEKPKIVSKGYFYNNIRNDRR